MNALNFNAGLALLIFAVVGRGDPLDTWTWRNPIPPPVELSAIAYGNGQFVAGGESGMILTSADGANWVVRRSGARDYISAIAYGKGQFVAVGSIWDSDSSLILISEDGVKWTQRQSTTPNSLSAITYGNGQFVA